jgi:hypothetical protein
MHATSSPTGTRWLGVVAVAATGALVVGFLLWPVLFTNSGLNANWREYMWFLWQQSRVIEHHMLPSLFAQSGATVFYPHYAFYGGTLYALGGLLAVLLGKVITAYVALQALAFLAVLGGWYWLGRIAGLGRWLALVPGSVFITSGYYLTDLYGRGDFGELIGVSTIPPLLASALHQLLARRAAPAPVLVLFLSTLLFFGSHGITLTLGSTTILVLLLATALLIPQARGHVNRAGVVRLTCAMAPAVLLNGWYLLPALAYGRRTFVASNYAFKTSLHTYGWIVSAKHLFTFSRANVIGAPLEYFVVALPLLAVAWVLASLALSLRRHGWDPWKRALWMFSAAALLIGLLMAHPRPLTIVTTPLTLIQFTYRIETYVLMAISAALLAGLAMLARGLLPLRRVLLWGIVPVLCASAVGAIEQVDGYRHYTPLSALFHETSWQGGRGSLRAYDDATLPRIASPGLAKVEFSAAEALRHEAASAEVKLPAGRLVLTNLVAAPYLVSVAGAQVVGRGAGAGMVMLVGGAPGTAVKRISVRPAGTLPVVAGRASSLLGLALTALLLVMALARALRARGC